MYFFDVRQSHLRLQAYAKTDRPAFAQSLPHGIAEWRFPSAKDHPAAMPGVD